MYSMYVFVWETEGTDVEYDVPKKKTVWTIIHNAYTESYVCKYLVLLQMKIITVRLLKQIT